MKYYVHNIPGRLRVRIPSLRNDPLKLEKVKTILDIDGTKNIKVNVLTGSIVIKYHPEAVNARSLLDGLKSKGYFHDDHAINLDTHLKQATNEVGNKMSRAMFGWVLGKVLEANGLGLIAALI